jgi:hypothetical protein
MTSARLLVVAICLCPLAAFTQEPRPSTSPAPAASSQTSSQSSHADAAKPNPDGADLEAEVLARAKANLDKGILISQDGQGLGDTFCFTMRTYVVARDNENSDAVHPVSYSTCQTSSRYHLKTTQARPEIRPSVDPSTAP